MRRTSFALALIAACALGACTTPKPTQVAEAAPAKALPATNQTDPNAMVCASVETTGSHFTTRECHTAHEWAVIRNHSSAELNNEATRSSSVPAGN